MTDNKKGAAGRKKSENVWKHCTCTGSVTHSPSKSPKQLNLQMCLKQTSTLITVK
jgi:hypothetical protein